MEEQKLLNLVDENVYLSHYYEAKEILNAIKCPCKGSNGIMESKLKAIRLNSNFRKNNWKQFAIHLKIRF